MIPDMNRRHFLMLAPAALVKGAETGSVTAETASGKVRGMEVDGIKIFKGIPYGASTAGKNRFMPPVPQAWTGVRDASSTADALQNTAPNARRSYCPAGQERRLPGPQRLDARDQDGRKRPVMFWCHGGGFATGSGSSPGTDGTNLAHAATWSS